MRQQSRVRKQVERLARSKANDAVRLAFLGTEELCGLEELDLSAVTEFKRNSNGTVEVKFIDRLAALQWLAAQEDGERRAERLMQSFEKGAETIQEDG